MEKFSLKLVTLISVISFNNLRLFSSVETLSSGNKNLSPSTLLFSASLYKLTINVIPTNITVTIIINKHLTASLL